MAGFSGHLALRAAPRVHGRTVLAAQSFRAPYHLSKPYWDADTRTLIAQVVNPTAGILSGDQLESAISVDEGAALLLTTPSASRVFKMMEGTAACRQQVQVAAGAWLEVMPEPLVPHRGCSYRQTTAIDVAPGGEVFFADLLMPGRVAHGEAWPALEADAGRALRVKRDGCCFGPVAPARVLAGRMGFVGRSVHAVNV